MAGPRRWQVPTAVAACAATATPGNVLEAQRYRDIASRQLVGPSTLLAATMAPDAPAELIDWAAHLYRAAQQAQDAKTSETLLAAGFDQTGCTPDAYGVLDPRFDSGERIVAVVRASGDEQYERWGPDGWEVCLAPEGMPYWTLRGELLSDALVAAGSGMSLILRPTQPRAFLPAKNPGLIATAADVTTATGPTTYAVTDQFDTSAVITLFQAAPGPKLTVRKGGNWTPDDGTLLAQLTSINPPPVVAVPAATVAEVIRQVDDFDTTHPQAASAPNGGAVNKAAPDAQAPAAPVAASAVDTAPKVAGCCVQAADTGRVFMIQRALDQDDPPDVRGTFEFPGGHIEDGEQPHEAAQREWEEETGHPLPLGPLDPAASTWTSPNGIYRGHVHVVPDESAIDITNRDSFTNPDDPDGDQVESVAWWDPKDLAGNPAVRPELHHVMPLVHTALQRANDPVLASITAHERKVREAHDQDTQFNIDRASADLAEQKRRRSFEQALGTRHTILVGEGLEPGHAAATVAREIEAEDARRELWEKDRAESLEAEKIRRLQMQPVLRMSAALAKKQAAQAGLTADAVPHTMMPPALLKYWVRGRGAAKVRWGEPGDYNRCRRELSRYVHPEQIDGLCAELHKLATGLWTSEHAKLVREAEGRK